jgi:hypothetical protein
MTRKRRITKKIQRLLENSLNGGVWAGMKKASQIVRDSYPGAAKEIDKKAEEFYAGEIKRRGMEEKP